MKGRGLGTGSDERECYVVSGSFFSLLTYLHIRRAMVPILCLLLYGGAVHAHSHSQSHLFLVSCLLYLTYHNYLQCLSSANTLSQAEVGDREVGKYSSLI